MSARTRKTAQLSARERYERELAALMMVADQRRQVAEQQEEERRKEEELRQKAMARQQLRQQKKLMFIAATKIQRVAKRYLARRKLASANLLTELLVMQKRRAAVKKLARGCRGVRRALAKFTKRRRERLLLEAKRAEVAQCFVGEVITHCIEQRGTLLWNIKLHIYALRVQTKFRAYLKRKKLKARMAKFRRSALMAAAFVGKLRRAVESGAANEEGPGGNTSGRTSEHTSARKRLTSARSDPALSTRPRSRSARRTGRTSRSSMSAAVDQPLSEIERLAREDPEKYKKIEELHQQK